MQKHFISLILFLTPFLAISQASTGKEISKDELIAFQLKNSHSLSSSIEALDTLIDFSNPKDTTFLYKDLLGRVVSKQQRNELEEFQYNEDGILIQESSKDKSRILITTYDALGLKTGVEYKGGRGHSKTYYRGDTTETHVFDPNGLLIRKSISTKDTNLLSKSYYKNPLNQYLMACGLESNYIDQYVGCSIKIIEKNQSNCSLTISVKQANGNTQLKSYHKTQKNNDSIYTIQFNRFKDTIKTSVLIGHSGANFKSAQWKEVAVYYRTNRTLNRKEVFTYGDFAEDSKKKFYNENGKPYLIETYKIEGTCGTPSVYPKEIIPGYAKKQIYYNSQQLEIDKRLTATKGFNYDQYFRLNSAYYNLFKYQTDGKPLVSENIDTLFFENQKMTVQEFKDGFYQYLMQNKVKYKREPTSYKISFTKEKGWSVTPNNNSQQNAFQRAFFNYVKELSFLEVRTYTKRGVYYSFPQEKGKYTYFKISGITWDCSW